MPSPWTLEKELCTLAEAASMGEALCRLGILEERSPAPEIEEVQDWTRGGAETFIYRFRVMHQSGCVHDVLLKAIVAFSTARSLSELGGEWLERRRLMEREGMRTPHLYFAGRALIVEEFVPTELASVLKQRRGDVARLVDQVMRYAAILDKHGFCPLSPFHSLRTDGRDVFVVDFGQDMGPPGVALRAGSRLTREAIRWLGSVSGQAIDEGRARAVYAFHAAGAGNEGIRWS